MLKRRGRATILSIALVSFAGVTASEAGAQQLIGGAYAPSGGVACGGGTRIQTASDGNKYAAAHDGVITSWGSERFAESMTFKVARAGSGNSFTVIGSDGPKTQAGVFPVRIPVRQGDVIGYYSPASTCPYGAPAGGRYSIAEGDTPAGSTTNFTSTAPYGPPLSIEATLERDRDNDGYGDETQDGCPTNAAVQGVCPLPTTIGRTIATAPDGGCGGYTYIPVEPRDFRYAVPADGVLTSWSSSPSGSSDGTIRLKTMRPQEGGQYVTVAQDPPRVPTLLGSNTFPTRIPVRQGDRIALAVTGDLNCLSSGSSGLTLQTEGDPPTGSSASFTERTRALSLAAVLEADRDNDGYGDTTQDRCPTNAATQGACPVKPPPPPIDKACEQARKKLKKAKAKLAKLKRNDAPAKKVKKAKKSVKRAKGKVKREC